MQVLFGIPTHHLLVGIQVRLQQNRFNSYVDIWTIFYKAPISIIEHEKSGNSRENGLGWNSSSSNECKWQESPYLQTHPQATVNLY